jgi:hypothetical protein
MENFMDFGQGDEETYITLKVDSGKVGGSVLWWRKVGSFQELTKDDNEKANYWDIGEVEWSLPEGFSEEDDKDEGARKAHGHGLAVQKTLDDNGHPFIELIYDTGDGKFVRALGKKTDGRDEPITDAEASRLHKDGVVTLEDHDVDYEGGSDGDEVDAEDEGEGSGEGSESGDLADNTTSASDRVAAGMKRKAEDDAEPDSVRKGAAPKTRHT